MDGGLVELENRPDERRARVEAVAPGTAEHAEAPAAVLGVDVKVVFPDEVRDHGRGPLGVVPAAAGVVERDAPGRVGAARDEVVEERGVAEGGGVVEHAQGVVPLAGGPVAVGVAQVRVVGAVYVGAEVEQQVEHVLTVDQVSVRLGLAT